MTQIIITCIYEQVIRYNSKCKSLLLVLGHRVHDVHNLAETRAEALEVAHDGVIVAHGHPVAVSRQGARLLAGGVAGGHARARLLAVTEATASTGYSYTTAQLTSWSY